MEGLFRSLKSRASTRATSSFPVCKKRVTTGPPQPCYYRERCIFRGKARFLSLENLRDISITFELPLLLFLPPFLFFSNAKTVSVLRLIRLPREREAEEDTMISQSFLLRCVYTTTCFFILYFRSELLIEFQLYTRYIRMCIFQQEDVGKVSFKASSRMFFFFFILDL